MYVLNPAEAAMLTCLIVLHEQKIVHTDVKPENVMFSPRSAELLLQRHLGVSREDVVSTDSTVLALV